MYIYLYNTHSNASVMIIQLTIMEWVRLRCSAYDLPIIASSGLYTTAPSNMDPSKCSCVYHFFGQPH